LSSVAESAGATQLTNWSYTYAAPGGADTNLRYTANQTVTPTSSWSNAFNPMENLTQSQGISYAYNGAAELCGSTCGGPGQTMTYYPSTALGSWGSYNYGYDSNGNMSGITGGGANVTMTYNVQNQLGSECNGCPSGSTTYAYRGVGQADRASATGVFGTQTWTSDLLGVSTETNTNSVGCTCYYIHDTSGNLIEEILTTGTYYPIFNGEGSIVAVTDSSGAVKDTFTYDPRGVVTGSATVYEPWQFQGEYADNSQSSGSYQAGAYQYHNGARYYEAGQMNGHWTQPDPANSPFSTTGWNGYNYAGGNSANLTDPNGICSWSWTDWTGCVADGAGSAWYGLGAATHYTWDHFKNEIVGCAAGGATGAVIGSIVPGIGNASGAIGGCLGGAATQAVGDLWGQPYKSEFSIINLVRRLSGLL
jgi:RHS repeat-associated protein